MKIIVQKYGGTSLGEETSRNWVMRHIRRSRNNGYHVVVVVSAVGRKPAPYATDTLLDVLHQHGDQISGSERDLLLGCGEIISACLLSSELNASGIPAIALTGAQAGIYTDDNYGNARIVHVDSAPIQKKLAEGHIPVVCGFQGVDSSGNITTLGRGGSDTTATALGVALNAECTEIYTDVQGIMTADPRIVQEAAALSHLTYAESTHFAYQGAKVIHPRAVEVAKQGALPIRIRNVHSADQGTLIREKEIHQRKFPDQPVTGIAHVPGTTQLTVEADKDDYQLHLRVFKAMSEHKISVDFINVSPSVVVYTVFDDVADQAITILKNMGYTPKAIRHCAKIAVVGSGMAGVPGIMSRIVEQLTANGITILQSVDSHSTIWILVHQQQMERAIRTLHGAFQLQDVR